MLAWIVGETIVHVAKVRSAKAPENAELRALGKHVETLEQRIDAQAELIQAQDDTIHRLEENAEFMERLLHGRDERALPERGT
jgi:capsule polysaccharide export protein KpsE/RkpR